MAICSPRRGHARQVEAVTAADKRVILFEKPPATIVQEAQLIEDVSRKPRWRCRKVNAGPRSAFVRRKCVRFSRGVTKQFLPWAEVRF